MIAWLGSLHEETLLFHERDEFLECVGGIREVVACAGESKLPAGQHEFVEGILDGGVGVVELFVSRSRKVDRKVVDKAEATCCCETREIERFGCVAKVFVLYKKGIGGKEVEEKRLTIEAELICCLICARHRADMVVPSSLNVTAEDFAGSGVKRGILDVEFFGATRVLPGIEDADEAFDVSCIWTERKVLFLGDGVVSDLVSVVDTDGGVVLEVEKFFQEDWRFLCSLKSWDGRHC